MPERNAARLLILCWSHRNGEMLFLKEFAALKEIAPVIISPSLSAVIRTALARRHAVVVLRPVTAQEHEQVEGFLLKIDRQNKINSHYVIVISSQGKRFKSGVQSHSVINTVDENAISRAVLHGIMINTKEEEPDQPDEAESQGPLPKPSLLQYFKLPAFKKSAPVLADLSPDDRELLVVTLNEMNHVNLGLPVDADPLERAAVYLRQQRATEVVIVSSSEVLRFGPTASAPISMGLVPPPGRGALDHSHPLFEFLGLPANMRLRYEWVKELDCCILSWSVAGEGAVFAQALIYTVLRMRRSEKFRIRQAA